MTHAVELIPRSCHLHSTSGFVLPLPWKNISRWVTCRHRLDGGGLFQFDEGGVLRGVDKRRWG